MSKLILSILLLVSTNTMANPRKAMKGFLGSMVQIKSGNDLTENYQRAYKYIDASQDTPPSIAQKKLLRDIMRVIDRIRRIDYQQIPNDPKLERWVFDSRQINKQSLEIALEKDDDQWAFTDQTIRSVAIYKKELSNTSVVDGVISINSFSDQVRSYLPPGFSETLFLLENWQWLALFLYFILAYFFSKILIFVVHQFVQIRLKDSYKKQHLFEITSPLGKFIFTSMLMIALSYLDLNYKFHQTLHIALSVFASVFVILAGKEAISFISDIASHKAKLTDTKFDDILIPLLTTSAYLLLYVIGIVLIAYSLHLDVTGIIAGLGIGGLAFAFAAKDTLANFFGSIMLVLDRPFDIGDYIIFDGMEGTVDEVGFRSTRIRTFYDSIITIANGELVTKAIDNKGKRRFRRLTTTLGIEYDTPPKKIEAFCDGIRQIIKNHKWTRKDYFNVYFSGFGASQLDIFLMVFWETENYDRELAERHRLMIDILRLANKLDVSFAFPTQTVHMFSEQAKKEQVEPVSPFNTAEEEANILAKEQISLKNPRSNALNKEQFGDNDVGL